MRRAHFSRNDELRLSSFQIEKSKKNSQIFLYTIFCSFCLSLAIPNLKVVKIISSQNYLRQVERDLQHSRLCSDIPAALLFFTSDSYLTYFLSSIISSMFSRKKRKLFCPIETTGVTKIPIIKIGRAAL